MVRPGGPDDQRRELCGLTGRRAWPSWPGQPAAAADSEAWESVELDDDPAYLSLDVEQRITEALTRRLEDDPAAFAAVDRPSPSAALTVPGGRMRELYVLGMAAAKHFETTIGVEVKGDTWSCVEIPDSSEFFGTRRAVRVDARVDDVTLENVGAMVTGSGGHMVSLSAKVRQRLRKDIGDSVTVTITTR